MTDDDLRRAYQARQKRTAGPPPTPEELDRLLSREGSDEERAELLDRALADPATAREFELLRAIHAADGADQPARTSLPKAIPWLSAAVVLIGVGIAALLPLYRNRGPAPDPVRGADSALALIEPIGAAETAPPLRFAWHPVADALSYDIEILDETDQPVASATVFDTVWSPPDGIRLAPGRSYRWWVAATTRGGAEIRAAPREFRVRAP